MADAARPLPRAVQERRTAPIRVVIGDRDGDRRTLIANALGEHSNLRVVAACHDGSQVVDAIQAHCPDLVLLAVQMVPVAGRLLAHASPPGRQDALARRFVVRSGNRMMFVDSADIDWIEADGNYVRVHAGTKSYRLRKTMLEMESALGAEHVARIHRRVLVRLARVRELRLKKRGRCDAVLDGGVILSVSRTYRALFKQRLGRG